MSKKVHVVVPHEIKFFHWDEKSKSNVMHTLNPGVQMIDEEMLNHPHVKAQGVKEYDPEAEAARLRAEADEAEAKAKSAREAADAAAKKNKGGKEDGKKSDGK